MRELKKNSASSIHKRLLRIAIGFKTVFFDIWRFVIYSWARLMTLATSPSLRVNNLSRHAWPVSLLFVHMAAALLLLVGCGANRIAITGAVAGVVTGPVTCITYGLVNGGILLLPVSFIYGPIYGWEVGGFNDSDFADFCCYDKPGTYRMSMVFLPFQYFPKGPGTLAGRYPGDNAVSPVRGD